MFSCEKQAAGQQRIEKKDASYAIAILPTPVLNTPDFDYVFGGKDGKTLKLSKNNLMEDVEFIALPRTVFTIDEIIKKNKHDILKVKTEDYPYPRERSYYIDSRFVEKKVVKPSERARNLPDRETIIKNLLSAKGSIYVWGGNYAKGVPEMLKFYKPSGELPAQIKDRWILKGVDCSGLLYEATDGYTPRNVEALSSFGKPVDIRDLNLAGIIKKLEPLDLIVLKRHVIIVINNGQAIQSTIKDGVHIKSLRDTLMNIMEGMPAADIHTKEAVTAGFIVRRWYP